MKILKVTHVVFLHTCNSLTLLFCLNKLKLVLSMYSKYILTN
ncbi:unnamed protein product [Arabidopsis halleri]